MSGRKNCADILCIGAQRAMTSWLHNVLAAHPGTWAFPNFEPVTSTSKEAHYWDWNRHRGERWYRVLTRPANDALKSLDFTPHYALLSEDEIDDCRRLNPGARVIYLLRDPLARAVSSLRMHLMWNGAKPGEAPVALDEKLLGTIEHARIDRHCDYAVHARRWRAAYPDLLVLSVEEIASDPEAAILQILRHCDLDTSALDAPGETEFRQRLSRRIWQTPDIRLSADVLHFLDGLTRQPRARCADELGLRFDEGRRILESVT